MTLTWIVVAIVAFGGEVLARHFFLVFVGVAAVVASALSALGVGLPGQMVVFVIVALALPLLLREQLVRRLSGRGVPSRTDVLVGTTAEVTQTIDPVLGTGRVIAGGQDWAARCSTLLPQGMKVTIVGADGIVLLVSPRTPPDDKRVR